MSQGGEVAHLGVINCSHRDHRDYTDKTRTVEGKNHRAQLGKREGEKNKVRKNNKIQHRHRQVERSRITIQARMIG